MNVPKATDADCGIAPDCAHGIAKSFAGFRGRLIGSHHRITRFLNSGGMANVFLVEHVTLATQAVAKVLPLDAAEHLRAYFAREAALLLTLDHPNIVRAHEYGQLLTGEPYLLMERAPGLDLATELELHGPMPIPRALWIVRQLASALDYLHGLGIVHRDIKPGNIVIDPTGNDPLKLLDFGIARRPDADPIDEPRGLLTGTPAYMAPEQAQGAAIGPAADNYALAALALELLTGEPPYAHSSPFKLVEAACTEQPRLPSELGLELPGLDTVMARALAKQPDDRFESAGELLRALRSVLAPYLRSAAPIPLAPAARAPTLPSAHATGGHAAVMI